MIRRSSATLAAAISALALANGCATWSLAGSGCKAPESRAAWAVTARRGRIEGQLRDLADDTPVGNVGVILDGAETGPRSDADGHFAFDSVADGRHLLTTNGTVYRSRVDTLTLAPGQGLTGTLYLALPKDVLKRCQLYNP